MEMQGRPRPKTHNYNQLNRSQNPRISLNSDTLLVLKLPDPRFLLVLSRSLFLATVIITLPCIRSVLKVPSGSSVHFHQSPGFISLEYWDLLWEDFANEGLIQKGHKALILNSAIEGVKDKGSIFMNNDEIDVVFEIEPDFQQLNGLQNEGFDFVFVSGSIDSMFVDRLVKTGGIVAMQLGDETSTGYQKQSDYRIVYLKKYRSTTIVAMKKLGSKNYNRRLCEMTMEAKKEALRGLEDVLFEPPRRRTLAKSHVYYPKKKINFLPDLLGDSLEDYPRRVFIDVGESRDDDDDDDDKNIVMKWFEKNYPKRNQEFEVYSFETVKSVMENVREEDYVVMKAEAGVVEKMIEMKVIGLVDELFLECNNQWQDEVNKKKHKRRKKSRRAYWECLALYGRLRDEGVAVHQWWG